ncbi:UNVERIFIED_CONTAM: hypothetical protein GTU68_004975 [Idotea baltica]|nr:hypothetical protein [Idotea baltica]
MSTKPDFKKIIAHCKEYGYIFQSSEIYDGLSAVYDYGPYGAELKKNIKDYWWTAMVRMQEKIVGLDSSIFMHPKTWKASGHVDAFNDPMVDNKDSKKRYRADVLIEDYIANKVDKKINKEIDKAAKRFGDAFTMSNDDMAEMKQIIEDLEIACPDSGSKNWTDVRQFNLMFSTQMGALADGSSKIYLRPETAQGIFVNFLNVQKTTRQKLPFGIAQIGKAFRNEIVARQFIFRMREFEQMEMQFFVQPGTEMEWYKHWKAKRMEWHQAILPANKLKFHDHENLAHYANAALDIEFEFPFGFKELEGVHSRTDFDLKAHQELSGKKLQYFDPETKESYVPYVVETSIGVDRMFLTIISNGLIEEEVPDAKGGTSVRTVLKIHPALAPIKLAVLPLLKNKEPLTDKAREVFDKLKLDFNCQYDEKDAIGKRYRRQDAIGTPFCVTVDFDTLEDNTVTLRNRDTMEQERINISEIKERINDRTGWHNLLSDF